MTQSDIKIDTSLGYSRGNKIVKHIRPIYDCLNKSRKVSGYTSNEINRKIDSVISKWYAPRVILYKIEGQVIGSNSKENALYEYWRVCDLKDVGKQFDVEILSAQSTMK